MPHPRSEDHGTRATATVGRYRHLPEPVRLEDTIASRESGEIADPTAERDPERDFLLRYAG
jgi:hypothetical protein